MGSVIKLFKNNNNNNNYKIFISKNVLYIFDELGFNGIKLLGKDILINKYGIKIFSYLNKNFILNYLRNKNKFMKYGVYIELNFEGLGYKIINLINSMLIKIGYSHYIKLLYISGLYITGFKKKIFIYGINKNFIKTFSMVLCKIKKIDYYKGKGLNLSNINIKLKEIKSNK